MDLNEQEKTILKDNLKGHIEELDKTKQNNEKEQNQNNEKNNPLIQVSLRTMADSIRKSDNYQIDKNLSQKKENLSKEEIKESINQSNDKVLIFHNDNNNLNQQKDLINPYKDNKKNNDLEEVNINIEKTKIKEEPKLPKKSQIKEDKVIPKIINSPEDANNENRIPLYFSNKEGKKIINLKYKSDSKKESTLTKKYLLTSFNDKDNTKMLQSMIRQDASDEIIDKIVNELITTYNYVMKNKNGNYFLVDLIKVCKPEHRLTILSEIYKTIADDCTDKFASHPIQALIDYSNSEEEYNLILYSFNDYNNLYFASLDPNGVYVIQKIITKIPEHFREEFNINFTSIIGFASKSKYGIITAKKFLDYTKDKDLIERILILIRNDFITLADDKYGNYLIQYLLEKWAGLPEGKEIKELILQNFKIMFQKKYSSFICEIYIKLLSEEEKIALIKTLGLDEFNNTNNQHVIKIMKLLGIYKKPNKY